MGYNNGIFLKYDISKNSTKHKLLYYSFCNRLNDKSIFDGLNCVFIRALNERTFHKD